MEKKGISRAKKEKLRKKKLKKVRFIRPVTNDSSTLDCIWYGIKAFWTMICSVISIPLSYLGALTGVLTWILIFGIAAGGVVYVKMYPEFKHCREVAYDTLAQMKDSDFSMLTDTEVYDANGNMIGLVNAGHYEYAKINDISMKIQNGYIAVEDKRFKTHPGFDWMSLTRAALALVKNNGEITQGGSTITQQVIKNTYLTQEQSFTRKITEILLAPEVEKRYSKSDIMEFYCNTNFYGHRSYGVQAASRYYFGKDAKDVDWHEAALLIGLSNSPSAYDPVKNPDKALEKRNRVLDTICEEGYFDKELLYEYKSKPLNIVQEYVEGTLENYQTSYAIHCAALELMKNDNFRFKYTFDSEEEYKEYTERYNRVYGEYSEKVRSGGYKIYTTLNSDIQSMVQGELDNGLKKFTEKQENGKYALQGAVVVVDNRSNHVVAIVGGRGADDIFNRGYLAVRQPGSTIKPLIDYAPAFETGEYYPSKMINDHKWEDGPSNSGGRYRGNITIREALNRSLNTVAWQVLQGVGVKNGLDYLGKMEFRTLTFVDNSADAVSLGGFTNGTRVVDMAKGYSTLANDGVYSDRTCITSIVHEKDGDVYNSEENKTQVFTEDTTYMINDILKGTMDHEYATGYGLDIGGQQAAGKTGTTNSNKDTWYCGYTRYYTTAVWVGYDTPRAMPGVFGATYAGGIWQRVMSNLHNGLEEWDWERPVTVVDGYYEPATGARVAHNTGLSDMFSTNADTKAQEARKQRERELYNSKVESNVTDFEGFNITSVEDTYLIEDKYKAVMDMVSLVEDEEVRKGFSNRVATKYQELINVKDEMKDVIEEFEAKKVEEEQAVLESKAAEDEELRLKQEKELRIGVFNKKLKAITDMKYQQDNRNDLVKEAVLELENLVDMEEYPKLLESLKAAQSNIKKLPTKAEWEIMEKERLEKEEQARLEAERLRLEEEERRKKELESIRGDLESPIVNGPETGKPSNYGPGMDMGNVNGTVVSRPGE